MGSLLTPTKATGYNKYGKTVIRVTNNASHDQGIEAKIPSPRNIIASQSSDDQIGEQTKEYNNMGKPSKLKRVRFSEMSMSSLNSGDELNKLRSLNSFSSISSANSSEDIFENERETEHKPNASVQHAQESPKQM
eukprot:CAMPEP_0204850906 /NCGR_PEP_ID=MMETSP1347-20130617/9043_1 /ASSEMBLY_ACC=CAM_ASM_000690 /TAXON_ID=215587 /ORGANISM="Aplanochytrium stocchinoi, Strain GSBS06" /LENGTH=134 /DNA_ID=CAMNT_0051994191 /DNA_START=127 /DNA_END=531 /DNA_ORIENTATION=-